MTQQLGKCHACGAQQLPPRPKWVTISGPDGSDPVTYRLGELAGHGQIFCEAKGVRGREKEWVAVRVCFWESRIRPGTHLITNGQQHHYHDKDPALNKFRQEADRV